jgi:hypothetical protein
MAAYGYPRLSRGLLRDGELGAESGSRVDFDCFTPASGRRLMRAVRGKLTRCRMP